MTIPFVRFGTAAAALSAALLAGCVADPLKPVASTPGYQAPSGGPSARLLVRVNHPGGRYSVSTFDQPVACTQRRQFESGTALEPATATFALTANKLQTLSFLHVRADRRGCELITSFEPRAGKTYLMRNFATEEGCRVELFDMSNPDNPVPERTRMRRERIGMGLVDNACKPLTSTVRGAAPAEARPDALEPFMDLLPRK